ncbi:MAG: phosphoglycerate kinase [Legionellales bacterium]|nr:phosphoglycerate kinase [Legionellales bacterium]OUX67093.1 MAG: phosphoglycerate kinase [bacterium TMED178]
MNIGEKKLVLPLPQIDLTQLNNKTVLVRLDLNLVFDGETLVDQTRWDKVVPTIRHIRSANPKRVVLLTHFGRPKKQESCWSTERLLPVIQKDFPETRYVKQYDPNLTESIVLLENTRFNHGEYDNDVTGLDDMILHMDCLIFDAFSVGHRDHASVTGLIDQYPQVYFGPHFIQEQLSIDASLSGETPRVAIIGGAKISTKLPLLNTLIDWADHLIVGGGIANTLLLANGCQMGDSLVESQSLGQAKDILARCADKLILPVDGITNTGACVSFDKATLNADEQILDIGPQSLMRIEQTIQSAKTIIWNGPLGYFERRPFNHGSEQVAKFIAHSNAFSIVGGGDSLSLINQLGLQDQYTYISTSGGAFLSYLAEGSLSVINTWRACHETH